MNATQTVDAQAKLKVAREIIADALISVGGTGKHERECATSVYIAHHRNFPSRHPVWEKIPACDCWLSRAAKFLIDN
jgi:hypothetical protein